VSQSITQSLVIAVGAGMAILRIARGRRGAAQYTLRPPCARQILVTNALPYVNADLHLGHLIEHVQTDIWVRFQRMRGTRSRASAATTRTAPRR
jgi:hypothetical protein